MQLGEHFTRCQKTWALAPALYSWEKMLISDLELALQANLFISPSLLPRVLWEQWSGQQEINISNTQEVGGSPPPTSLPDRSLGSPPGPLPYFLSSPSLGPTARVEGDLELHSTCPDPEISTSFPEKESEPKDVTPLFLLPMGQVVPGRMCASL